LRDALVSQERGATLLSIASLHISIRDPYALATSLLRAWAPLCAQLTHQHELSTALTLLPYEAFGELKGELKGTEVGAHILYKRADLMLLALSAEHSCDQGLFEGSAQDTPRYLAYVDGSEGAAEAALQVLLQRLLRLKRGLLVHASGGVYGGQAWLIPGPSGAGKSTAVRRGGFERVLCDEMIALTLDPHPTLWGTPFWSEGREALGLPLTLEDAPLEALTFPRKALTPQLTPLSPLEASRALMRCVTCYEQGAEAREAHASLFELVCELVERAPSFTLSFPKEGPWRSLLSVDASLNSAQTEF
jgi:hypothetical protein